MYGIVGNHMNSSVIWEIIPLSHALEGRMIIVWEFMLKHTDYIQGLYCMHCISATNYIEAKHNLDGSTRYRK